jgi:hypothetical protein
MIAGTAMSLVTAIRARGSGCRLAVRAYRLSGCFVKSQPGKTKVLRASVAAAVPAVVGIALSATENPVYYCTTCGQINDLDDPVCCACLTSPPAQVVCQDQTQRRSITLSAYHGGMIEEIVERYYDGDGRLAQERIERRSWAVPASPTPSSTLRAFAAPSFQTPALAQPAQPAPATLGAGSADFATEFDDILKRFQTNIARALTASGK